MEDERIELLCCIDAELLCDVVMAVLKHVVFTVQESLGKQSAFQQASDRCKH